MAYYLMQWDVNWEDVITRGSVTQHKAVDD